MAGLDHTGKAGAGGEFAQQATQWSTPTTQQDQGITSELNCKNPSVHAQAATWHTPTTMAAKSVPYQRVNGKDVLILTGQAESWPTPSAAVVNDGESPETWHARAEKLKAKHTNGNGAGLPLTVATAQWPTPVSSDQKSQLGGGMPERMNNRTASPSLSQMVTHSHYSPPDQPIPDGPPSSPATRNSPRHLNPLFGAWLMGWPSTWVIAEPHASSASATELWRCKLQSRLSSLFGDPERLSE